MIRAAIIDDDALVRSFLKIILGAHDIAVVGEADDGDQAVDLVARTNPDVVLMDLRMRRLDGIEAARLLQALPHPPGVVALTSFDTRNAVLDAVDAGVAGFLAKDSGPEEIATAVISVARGEGALSPRAARVVLEQMQHSVTNRDRLEARRQMQCLSKREMEAATLVSEGMSNPEIASAMSLSEATVKTHLAGAMQKLGVANRVQLAVTITRGSTA